MLIQSGSSVLIGRASPGCGNKGCAPTSEWVLLLLLPNKVHKGMVLKRRDIACNKHVNDNLKRWEAAAGTPTINLTALNLPARLLSQVQEVVILSPV